MSFDPNKKQSVICERKLSSDESVTVLDAVAMSAINDATPNFLGDRLISVVIPSEARF